ncbi:MAG: DUF169 domain-containing protein [Deltaproteobacteria bacterium]|nr:DUF169 domain-containing protein [Deltaproteobacteria bacterium]MCK5010671.1 DUF169 domain-containing protein [Deltaproteobacteria bacterium]
MMTDLKAISDLLINKGKVRGKPVGISLFRDTIPEAYQPIQDTPCSIVRYAMDEGKKVYFDKDHHDCLVGVHHAGITPGSKEIVDGEYLSKTSTFFSFEGAARLKSGSFILPPGMVRAIGAAPLDEIPEGVTVDWVVVVCNPHNANNIAGCRVCRDGVLPHGEVGTSLCGTLFATPWHVKNIVYTFGDFGGRMHNRIKQDQLFVIVPNEFLDCLPELFKDMKLDVKTSREMTKPPHSSFWQKKKEKGESAQLVEEQVDISSISFTMEWDNEAKELMKKVPEGIVEMAVSNAEEFAKEKGYTKVSKKSIQELMEKLGMNLDDM